MKAFQAYIKSERVCSQGSHKVEAVNENNRSTKEGRLANTPLQIGVRTQEGWLNRYSTAPCTLPPARRSASIFLSNS